MTYDIEASKRETSELKRAFAELFPLVDERDLPRTPSHIKDFLRKRIEFEVERGVFHFQSRVVRILCEISPPKTHVEDMARIVVNQAKETDTLHERCNTLSERLTQLMEANKQLAEQLLDERTKAE